MSGPRSSRVSKLRLSLASPPVRWKARGSPSRSHLRWILVENPPRERPSAWPLCPLCAGNRDIRAHDRRTDHLNEMSGAAGLGQERQHRLENPPLAQPPKPLPHTIPLAKLCRQSPPSDIVNREVMQRLQ